MIESEVRFLNAIKICLAKVIKIALFTDLDILAAFLEIVIFSFEKYSFSSVFLSSQTKSQNLHEICI